MGANNENNKKWQQPTGNVSQFAKNFPDKWQQPTGNVSQFAKRQAEANKSSSSGGSSAPDNAAGSGESKQAPISLPVGGGAIRGIGEKFQANPVTGTASFTVPLTISEGRGGFTPQLALSYDSGSGNSVFGLGWSVGLPSITRKTDKGLPQYNDNANHESDVFILSGAEDLVPVLREEDGKQFFREENGYKIYTYQPRTEGLFALIERWVKNGVSHWRTISKENITSIYGFIDRDNPEDSLNHCVIEDQKRIFSWLIRESWDAKGNLMQFTYKPEDGENVEDSCYERSRREKGERRKEKEDGRRAAGDGRRATEIDISSTLREAKGVNKYLEKVSYGNMKPCMPLDDTQSGYKNGFHFHLVFDYGENYNNELVETKTWCARLDAFSNYRAGFEIRTYRLCRRILMFHKFEELGNEPVLVRSTDLEYDETAAFSLLKNVTHKGYDYATEVDGSFPELSFSYTEAKPAEIFREVPEEMLKQLPAGVDGQSYQWADLYSTGVSGILTMNNYGWYFKENFGDKQFSTSDCPICDYRISDCPICDCPTSDYPTSDYPTSDCPTSDCSICDYPTSDCSICDLRDEVDRGEHTPVLGGMKREVPRPAAANNKRTTFRLNDVDSDGFPELVIQGDGVNGYYTRDEDGKWLNFRNFQDNPNINYNDSNLRFMDLSGDGLADIVISKGETFDIYFRHEK